MTTTVTLTGTGVPLPSPTRAGAGVLVTHEDTRLQFDAGRATVLRLASLGVLPQDLSALFLTHLHSDHVSDVADLAHTRWVQQHANAAGPLTVVAASGHAEHFLDTLLTPYAYDIEVRGSHVDHGPLGLHQRLFALPSTPTTVWTSPDEAVSVSAVRVRHEPVEQAVAYRVDAPTGSVVISGDTRVCAEVEELAAGADVLVHEACRSSALAEAVKGTRFETIFSYHADTVALGGLAQRAAVGHLVLTHLIPAPSTPEERAGFVDDVRQGGFTGPVTVGDDLFSLRIGSEVDS